MPQTGISGSSPAAVIIPARSLAEKKLKTSAMAAAATETIMQPVPMISAHYQVSVNRAAASSPHTRRTESRTLEGG